SRFHSQCPAATGWDCASRWQRELFTRGLQRQGKTSRQRSRMAGRIDQSAQSRFGVFLRPFSIATQTLTDATIDLRRHRDWGSEGNKLAGEAAAIIETKGGRRAGTTG